MGKMHIVKSCGKLLPNGFDCGTMTSKGLELCDDCMANLINEVEENNKE